VSLAGVVCGYPLVECEVAAAEDLDDDPQLARRGAGALHGAFGAVAQRLDVFDGGDAPSASVVVGVLGVRGHDAHESAGGDVVPAQYCGATFDGCRQHFVDPVRTTAPSRYP